METRFKLKSCMHFKCVFWYTFLDLRRGNKTNALDLKGILPETIIS